MIIVSIWVELGCKFSEDEYSLYLDSVVQDNLDLNYDIEKIKDCIDNCGYEIKEEVLYTFFLNRANIAAPYPHIDPAFDVQQVIENIHKINVQL